MKKTVLSLGVIGIVLVFSGCQSKTSNTVSITHFRLTNESVQLTSSDPIAQSISLKVRYEVTDENDVVSNVILAEGQLVDGELLLAQSVTEPTEVLISLIREDGLESPGATALLRPDSEIEFVVIHQVTSFTKYYQVLLNGTDHRSLRESQRFSLKGDLSQLPDFNAKHVRVLLYTTPSLVDGSGASAHYGPVFVDEDEFSFEGDLEKPTVFTIGISYGNTFSNYGNFHAVLEPGIDYRVVPWGNQGKFAVVADQDSLQSQLLSNWQFDPETVALVNTWVDSRLDSDWGMEREDKEKHENEQIRNYTVAEQCDHVPLTEWAKSKFIEPYTYSYQKTGDLIVTSWSETLRQILRDTQDPDLARMIFELSWRQLGEDEIIEAATLDERIAILEELALVMDEEFVDQFITPLVEDLMEEEKRDVRVSTLRPGQVAPKFTLTTRTGDEVSLSEVLSENELVLVAFWASWCGWCVRSFPELKRLYKENKDQGFEIVTISIDDSFERWRAVSNILEIPWIDLGNGDDNEMKGDASLIADAFEVRLTRASSLFFGKRERDIYYGNRFLIDRDGCILNKKFFDFELSEMLTSRSEERR